jgi:hypothetical protein
VIWERFPVSYTLYEDLPVVQIPNMDQLQSKQDYVEAIQRYIQSDKFQNSISKFATEGWPKLFLQHKRRMVLKDTGRDREVLHDEEGNPYYQAYRYTPGNGDRPIYCHNHPDNCKLTDEAVLRPDWLGTPEGRQVDEAWVRRWNHRSSSTASHGGNGMPSVVI